MKTLQASRSRITRETFRKEKPWNNNRRLDQETDSVFDTIEKLVVIDVITQYSLGPILVSLFQESIKLCLCQNKRKVSTF